MADKEHEQAQANGSFPKDLRYDLANRIDKKVWIAYAIVFLIVGSFLLGVSYIKPSKELTENDVLEIKKRFAKLELNKPKKEEPKKEEEQGKKEKKEEKEKPKIDRKNESKEEKQERKKETEESRAQVREQLKKDIDMSGLFAELTALGDEGDEVIDEIFEQGDEVDLGDIDLDNASFSSKPSSSPQKRNRKGTQVKSEGLGKQVITRAEAKKVKVSAEVKLSKPKKITGAASGDESRSANSIEKVIRRIQNKIKLQFEKYLRQDPNLSGKVEVEFTILADGNVTNVQIASSTLKHSAFERRLISMIKRLKFATASAKIQITYPFIFAASRE